MPDAEIKTRLPMPFFRVLREELRSLGYKDTCFEPVQLDDWNIRKDDLNEITPEDRQTLQSIRDAAGDNIGDIPTISSENADKYIEKAACFNLSPSLSRSVKEFNSQSVVGFAQEQIADDKKHLVRLMFEDAMPSMRRVSSTKLQELYQFIHKNRAGEKLFKRGALCLSGGGIRSATFGLGIMQGLARKQMLDKVHYISTVSGGGYIGSWLTAWIYRSNNAAGVFKELEARTSTPRRADLAWNEPAPIRFLRAYSNYLTPKLGLFAADTWVLVATYLRNLLLNWLVFIPVMVAVAGVPCLYFALVRYYALAEDVPVFLSWGLFVGGCIALVCMVGYTVVVRPSDGAPANMQCQVNAWFNRACLFPAILAALCFSLAWAWSPWSLALPGEPNVKSFLSEWWLAFPLVGAVIHCCGWFGGQWVLIAMQSQHGDCFCRSFKQMVLLMKRLWRELICVTITGIVGGLLLCLEGRIFGQPQDDQILYAALSVPAVLTAFLLTTTLFVGFTAFWTTDEDREWWARMGGWLLIVTVAWPLVCAVTFVGPFVFFEATTVVGSVGGITGLYTIIAGHSAATPATNKQQSQQQSSFSIDILLKITAPVFVIILFAAFAILFVWSLNIVDIRDYLYASSYDDFVTSLQHFDLRYHLLVFAALIAIAWLCAVMINVNRFSLHAVYRNRLVRAYLGASNPNRRPNPFTGFDPNDNFSICKVQPKQPLHIVNMALNLVSGNQLAWQERKAETFTSSTLHCGNYHLGYRSSVDYASQSPSDTERKRKHPEFQRFDIEKSDGDGITLGSAMAISGAAANSNMGYHSSSVLCFLLTLFNVRLGCWLGNPGLAGNGTYKNESPDLGALYAFRELFGLTDDTSQYVMLSDGGHFENLGLFEMVLRRCDWIVVSDGGCDPKCSLEDFGNAIRKIRTDLGIPITVKQFGIYSRNDERYKNLDKTEIGKYCAIAEVDYAAVDGNGTDNKPVPPGLIIYFKASLTGTEPKDVYNYKSTSPDFPHESTADQWFSESQFESYRALGVHAIEHACSVSSRAPAWGHLVSTKPVGDFIAEIHNYIMTDVTPPNRVTYTPLPLPQEWLAAL